MSAAELLRALTPEAFARTLRAQAARDPALT
jgi:hypothetical protein